MFKHFIIAVATLLLSGCFSDPHYALEQRQPSLKPVRNATRMDSALVCMDNLLSHAKLAPIYVTSSGIPNRAGDKVAVNSGTLMLMEAISGGLAKNSNVFRYMPLNVLAPSALVANSNQKENYSV